MYSEEFLVMGVVLCFGLFAGSHSYTGSVFEGTSGQTCVRSGFQVISDMQGVAMSNLLPSMVYIELSILGRISQRVTIS